ncbi:MAG: hypothetical protein WCX90_07605 [Thiohalomonadaceae bacterium]
MKVLLTGLIGLITIARMTWPPLPIPGSPSLVSFFWSAALDHLAVIGV